MKHFSRLVLVLAFAASTIAVGGAQQPSQAQTDVYHVHFVKAVPGQAAELGALVQKPNPQAPMPEHFIVLRHQQGDDWDYCVIQHLGAKATVDTAPPTTPDPATDMRAWHSDTFTSGPAWPDFAKAMGITTGAPGTPGAVYSVAIWRPVPGHRMELQQLLGQPTPGSKVQTGIVVLQHLEGGPWSFLALTRYNSWQDFATSETESATATGQDDWAKVRQFSTYHHDTLADRLAPK